MNGKKFGVVLGAVLVLGSSYGGVFAGGLIVGKSQGEEKAVAEQALALPTQTPETAGFQLSPENAAALQERLAAQFGGEVPPDLAARIEQFQSGGGAAGDGTFFFARPDGAPGGGFGGGAAGGGGLVNRGGVAGKITSVEDGKFTMTDDAGTSTTVVVQTNTSVQSVGVLAATDLKAGDSVQVRGIRDEDGSLQAVSVTLALE